MNLYYDTLNRISYIKNQMMTSAYKLTSLNWAKIFEERNYPLSSLNYWIDGIYKDRSLWQRHVATEALNYLQEHYSFELPSISQVLESQDGTTKFQIRFADDLEVETVLIPFHKRYTICLSTQVGCAMNCTFCYTGTQGLKRHLTSDEIVGQYAVVYAWLLKKQEKSPKPNIVFMGQGEPLHNSIEVKTAIEVFSDPRCLGLGLRQITLSTVGYIPGLLEFNHFPKINLALSLHSPFEEERNKLIPLNKKYPLKQVLIELDKLELSKRQYLTFEYLMIKNFNMSETHVAELAHILSKRKAILNLIPFNPFPGSTWERPTDEEIEVFKNALVKFRIRVMVRNTKGDDILAACGQLKINEMMRNYDSR